jgi:hypothetical protein
MVFEIKRGVPILSVGDKSWAWEECAEVSMLKLGGI